MTSPKRAGYSTNLLASIFLLQSMLNIAVYWDIPIVRQLLGFLYLTFIPGVLVLKLLKADRSRLIEVTLFSAGLSIAILMFLGLLLNELLPMTGISTPLSAVSLIFCLNFLVISLCVVELSKNGLSRERFRFHISLSFILVILVFCCLLLLSFIGTSLMNASGENSILLLMTLMTPIAGTIALVLHKKSNLEVLALALLAIYVSTLIATWGATSYIIGYDSHLELYSFRITSDACLWRPVRSFEELDKSNTMLSVTVLPTIYSKILNLDATWVFKIVYPLLASFVPLGLYLLFSTQTNVEVAFLGTFFFISNAIDGLGSLKQWIATIFYVLLFLLMFSERSSSFNKKLLFVIFGGALIVSHYALSYLFLFIMVLVWAVSFFLKKRSAVTLTLIFIFFSMAFAWYLFTAQSAVFDAVAHTFDHIYNSMSTEFFNPESRGTTVMTEFGLIGPPTYIHLIGRLFSYLTQFLIILGFVVVLIRSKKLNFNFQFFIITCVNFAILIMTVVVPNFAEAFGMQRFYRMTLAILAPLCVLGGEEILGKLYRLRIRRLRKEAFSLVLMLTVMTPFFLFQTGFIYEVANVESWSLSLSRNRMPPVAVSESILYTTDVNGATWLSTMMGDHSVVYADYVSKYHVLTSYGLIDWRQFNTLTNTTGHIATNGLIYLRRLNTVLGIFQGDYTPEWNTTDISPFLDMQNRIYSNSECEISAAPD